MGMLRNMLTAQDKHSHFMYAYLLSFLRLLHSLLSGYIEGGQHRSRNRGLRKEWLECSRLTSLENRERWSALIVLAVVTKTAYSLKRGQDNVSNALEQKIVSVRKRENCSVHELQRACLYGTWLVESSDRRVLSIPVIVATVVVAVVTVVVGSSIAVAVAIAITVTVTVTVTVTITITISSTIAIAVVLAIPISGTVPRSIF